MITAEKKKNSFKSQFWAFNTSRLLKVELSDANVLHVKRKPAAVNDSAVK